MRTLEKFQKTWKELESFVALHNKPVWLIARESDYCLSVIEPEEKDLPFGTVANLYDPQLQIIKSIISSKSL